MSEIEDKIPSVIENIRRNMGLEPDDDSKDDEIAQLSRREQFERFMTWNGIIGYEDMIKEAISEIYEVVLEE